MKSSRRSSTARADLERRARATLEQRRRKTRNQLLAFVQRSQDDYLAGWVHADICRRLEAFSQAVARGESPRLMLFVPPRHGKSFIVSERFPAWHLGHHPEHHVVVASYAASLAKRASKKARGLTREDWYAASFPELALDPEKQAVEEWETTAGGGYKAVGVGGGLTGSGANVLIIDDPIKDRAQAESAAYREAVYDWYTSTAYTRLMPGGGVLVMHTRWHEDDLAGRLLRDAELDGDQWEIIRYPAIAEVDEEHRKAGEALHPERYSLERLEAIKGAVGTRDWASLYQQRPAALEGGIVKLAWFKRYGTPPANPLRIVQSWDTANKAKEINDPWVCSTWAETATGYYLLDVYRKRMEYPEGKRTAKSLGEKWQPHAVLIEDKSSGSSLIQDLRIESNLPVLAVTPTTDKVVRMSTQSHVVESGRVFLPESAPWLVDFEAEVGAFPQATHDDQVDSMSQFLAWVGAGLEPRIRRL